MEERLQSHYEALARVIGFTRTADSKAAPVLAGHLALAGTLAARRGDWAGPLANGSWDTAVNILLVLLVVYASFSILALLMAGSVYLPRTPTNGTSLIYFADVGTMPLHAFIEQAKGMEPERIEEQLLEQIHTVSKIVVVKMHRVRWAYLLSAPAGAIWVVLLAWGGF